MYCPQAINNRFSSRISGLLNLALFRLRLDLTLLRVVGSSTPD